MSMADHPSTLTELAEVVPFQPRGFVDLADADVEEAPRQQEDDLVRWLRAALGNVDARRAELATAGDFEGLAFGLVALKVIVDDLRTLIRSIEDDVVALLPAKKVVVDGLGVLEKKKGSARKAWQSEDLLGQVIRLAVDPDGTGEIPPPGELLERLRSTLVAVVPFTGSLGWRVGALRDLGLDPDEWCHTEPGRIGLQITDNRSDAP